MTSTVVGQELEEDPELRSKVALYRDPAVDPAAIAARRAAAMAETDEDDDVPEVREFAGFLGSRPNACKAPALFATL